MEIDFAVIFDMDGVIVDSNPVHQQAIQEFCRKYDKRVTEAFLHNRVYGRTNKEWIPELFGQMSPEQTEALGEEKERIFRQMFDPARHVVTGITEFVHHLHENRIQMAVATSAPRANADYILSELHIQKLFTTVLDSSHVERGKPEPDVYIKASSFLGFSPQQCLVIEDSMAGVEAGLAAGCRVTGVSTTHTAEELQNCHLVINDFRKLAITEISELMEASAGKS